MLEKTVNSTDTDSVGECPLSTREREVLHWMLLGFVYHRIADELGVSPHTVRRHIENIYRKLNVNARAEAILLAVRRGWINTEAPI